MNETKLRRKFRKDVKRIERRILSYDGKTVEKEWYLPKNLDPSLFKLFLKKGRWFPESEHPDGVIWMRGMHDRKSKDCVKNVERIMEHERESGVRYSESCYRICEGFALAPYGHSKNSRWFRHTWAYDCGDGCIIENTLETGSLRCKYWGVIIEPEELESARP